MTHQDSPPAITDQETILAAFNLCVSAHEGQIDRDGFPHAFHSIRVAEKQTTTERIVIGLLHDVCEDSDVPLAHIEAEFGYGVAQSVLALTRFPDEPWSAYIDRVLLDRNAMHVKKADIEDNTRVERVDEKAAKRFPMYKEAHAKIVARLAA